MKFDLLHWQLELWFITCLYYINVCELATNVYGAFYLQQFCIVTLSPISFLSLSFNDIRCCTSYPSIPICQNETEFPASSFLWNMKIFPFYNEYDAKLMDRFMFQLWINYRTTYDEMSKLESHTWNFQFSIKYVLSYLKLIDVDVMMGITRSRLRGLMESLNIFQPN